MERNPASMFPRLPQNWRAPAGSSSTPFRPPLGSALLPLDVWSRLRESLSLSDRELQIVQGIFEDQKQETIAYNLGISPHSVNTYIQRIYAKLRIGSRPQLIVRVVSEYLGLVANDAQMARSSETEVGVSLAVET
jgi:DNA-binding CsgD family transcriptional regulator